MVLEGNPYLLNTELSFVLAQLHVLIASLSTLLFHGFWGTTKTRPALHLPGEVGCQFEGRAVFVLVFCRTGRSGVFVRV